MGTRRKPDFSFMDDEGEVFVTISTDGLAWSGDSHSPNWGGGYGIGHQDFGAFLDAGPLKAPPADVLTAIEARVRALVEQGYAGVASWSVKDARERLERGADLAKLDATGGSLLHAGYYTAQLIEAGADVNMRNPQTGQAPLHEAARRSSLASISALVAAGAELDARDGHDRTPLEQALEMLGKGDRRLRLETVQRLVDAGAARPAGLEERVAEATNDLSFPQFVAVPLSDGRTWSARFDSYDLRTDTAYYRVTVRGKRSFMAAVDGGQGTPDREGLRAEVAARAEEGVSNTEYSGS
ncbi:MAG: hypothetical protein KDA24_12470 [Deltaproteobacteria bacterium]|nr:hypothetical protein [Deltaproteobacteria bacterium]